MVRLYSYVVALDTGFAPNPFHGYCTLATCMPQIRERARKGDWIIGTGSNSQNRRRGGRLVFAMRVTEKMSFDGYWNDPRFLDKKPIKCAERMWRCGDNIYSADPCTGERRSVEWSFHCKPDEKCKDSNSDWVLISNDFVYWGGGGPCFPEFNGISILFQGRGYKKFPGNGREQEKTAQRGAIQEFVNWFRERNERGRCGYPTEWAYRTRKPWGSSWKPCEAPSLASL